MNFQCNTKSLSNALKVVGKVTGAKYPANRLLVNLDETGLNLAVCDGILTICASVPDAVVNEGIGATLGVSKKDFAAVIKSMTDPFVTIRGGNTDKGLVVHSETGGVFVNKIEGAIQTFEEPTSAPSVVMATNDFRNLVQSVAFAVSKDGDKPVLYGVYVELYDNDVTMTALDGFRMASHSCKQENTVTEPIACVVPGKSLMQAIRAIPRKSETKIEFGFDDRYFWIKCGSEIAMQIKLIEEDFVPYEKIFPRTVEPIAVVSREYMLNALKLLESAYKKQDNNTVRLLFKNDSLRIDVVGTPAIQKLAIETPDDEPLEIAFNASYLKDMLKALKDRDVTFSMAKRNSYSPIDVRSNCERGRHLILPIMLTR